MAPGAGRVQGNRRRQVPQFGGRRVGLSGRSSAALIIAPPPTRCLRLAALTAVAPWPWLHCMGLTAAQV